MASSPEPAAGHPRPGPAGAPISPPWGRIDDCVHCGFCLPTCPTYVLWGEEMDSPRGRIVLMSDGLGEGGELSPQLVGHLDNCLGCMACVTACPSGVKSDQLITRARPQLEAASGARATSGCSAARSSPPSPTRAACARGFPRPARAPGRPQRAARPRAAVCGTLRASRRRRARAPSSTGCRGSPRRAASGAGRSALLQGCVQRVFFSGVNEATSRC